MIDKEDDTINMFIPCGTQMLWYGADDNPTRTGSDAQTQWASVQFSWQDKTWLPPYHAGVRIAFNGYKDRSRLTMNKLMSVFHASVCLFVYCLFVYLFMSITI